MGWLSNHKPPVATQLSEEVLALLQVSTPEGRAQLAKELAAPGTVPNDFQLKCLELIWSGKAEKIVEEAANIIQLPISPL